MKVKSKFFKQKIFVILSLVIVSLSTTQEVEAFTNQVIQRGATGEDVVELQARLQYIGFYNGGIDGVFGWGTYWALRNFQEDFGLPIDGLAGKKTKEKLVNASKYHKQFVHDNINQGNRFTHYGGQSLESQVEHRKNKGGGGAGAGAGAGKKPPKASPKEPAKESPQEAPQGDMNPSATNMPGGFSQNDIQLMANAVYGEARGELYTGQVAVAAVILNRISDSSFPNTVSGVIFEPGAFTAVADGQIWLTPNETAQKAVLDAINGWDPSGQAMYYFNPDTATSSWIWTRPQIKKIGNHIFCK